MGKDDFYTDDSECIENNYCGKTIVPIKCEGCEYKQVATFGWVCLEKLTIRNYSSLESMFANCPIPTEPIRCASCGTALGYNAPHVTYAGTGYRQELVDRKLQWSNTGNFTVISNDEYAKLKAENAQLRLKNDELDRVWREANKILSSDLGMMKLWEHQYKELIGKLQSEIESLKSQLPKVGWIPWNDHVQQVTELNNEIERLKANQLSTDEIESILACIKDLIHVAVFSKDILTEKMSPIIAKLQSMKVVK